MSAPCVNLQTLASDDSAYPMALKTCAVFKNPPALYAIGNLELLSQSAIALCCSGECPSDLILKTYALVQSLCDRGILTISGFHSPIEQDCLKILLQGTQPIIHCPARSLHKMRLSPEQKRAVESDRLLLISPFNASYSRATADLAAKRNEVIGAIAYRILIVYAAPKSKTLVFAQRLVQAGRSVVTFDSPDTTNLRDQGVAELNIDGLM